MVRLKGIRILLFLLCPFFAVYSQDYLFDVEEINVENGLPFRSTFSVAQDTEGFIWVSMQGAISRYDGYQFKTYDYNFLKVGEDIPLLIAADKNNLLWYCERNLVQRTIHSGIINTKNDSIYELKVFSKGLLSAEDVIYINQSEVSKTDIFITTRSGVVYKYNGEFEAVYRFPDALESYAIGETSINGGYWIVYDQSAFKIKNQQRTGEVYKLPINSETISRIISQTPTLIVESKNNTFFHLRKYWELKDEAFVPLQLGNENYDRLQVFQKSKDYTTYADNDIIFVQNNKGEILYRYNEIKTPGSIFKYEAVFVDKQNIFWIAASNGLYKVISKKNPFKIYQKGQSIRGIYRDGNELYIGSYDENKVFNLTDNSSRDFLKILENQAVNSFFKDNNEHLWVGTANYFLFEFNPKNKKWTEKQANKNTRLYVPFKNKTTDKLWIGTSRGLVYIDKKTQEIEAFELPVSSEHIQVRAFHQNKRGIWVISNQGIFLMDSYTEAIIKHYTVADGLPSNNLNQLHEDKDGIFWLASKDGGLIEWNVKENSFVQYTIHEGLSNNTIYAVYEDDYNNLWLPSNYGLMRFNKTTHNVRVYLPENGIAHEEFNTFAHFKDNDGNLYFGGLEGVTVFHPKDLREEVSPIIPIHLTQLRILNENSANFIDKTNTFLSEHTVILTPSDRVLEMEISLLDYADPNELRYMYQIEGYQEQWLYTNSNKLTINNLPYGEYTINIKGRALTTGNSSEVLHIPVLVKKPFYLTWQFIFAINMLVALLIFVGIKWRIATLKNNTIRLEEEVKIRTQKIEDDKQVIEKQAEALKTLDKAKTRFFSNITHEFRTPLTLIIGPLQQLMDDQPPPIIFKRRMKGILKNAKHILDLINQLLDLSKLEAGQMKLEVVHGDIVAHTKDIVNQFQAMAFSKEQQLIFKSDRESWNTFFDQSKWDKIIYNLVSNAIKFTPNAGSIQISLLQHKQNEKDFIRINVIDSGIGISEANLVEVFNRFYQVDDSSVRIQEGTGIGLSLVKELVTLQGGEIKVISTEGKGTTFEVLLPVMEGDETKTIQPSQYRELPVFAPQESIETTDEVTSENEKETLEVLIVEDNAEMREYIRQCLKGSLYNITEASNGEEGLQKAQALIPDLIISDVMMPKMDGYQLTQAIRENVSTSHIPLVLLTAKSSLESKLKGLKRGADAYLIKPFSPVELTVNIQNLLEIRHILQQRYLSKVELVPENIYEQEDIFIVKLKQYILENIDEPNLNGDTIGQQLGLSRVHLYRKLKALTDSSITDFVKTIRLEKAFELLKEGKLNVSEVADLTGFSSVSHFSSSFKKAFGKAPSQV